LKSFRAISWYFQSRYDYIRKYLLLITAIV